MAGGGITAEEKAVLSGRDVLADALGGLDPASLDQLERLAREANENS